MATASKRRQAIIIGAGPAGLTAAYELLTRSDIQPVILEKTADIGGISRTINYKGNRMDIGGHRFFSKSDRVMDWWMRHLSLETLPAALDSGRITYRNECRKIASAPRCPESGNDDEVMLVRQRKSRIYFLRKFFDYPISLSRDTLSKLGIGRTVRIGLSYLRSVVFPPKTIENLEQFFISRFGRELYLTFFKSYTEKVWGVPCTEISAEWGAQRIKGLSITKTIAHMVKKVFCSTANLSQKDVETSLIERFLYPKFGPGQIWEIVAKKITQMGGIILSGCDVNGLRCEGNQIRAIIYTTSSGIPEEVPGDFFFSTMPIQELIGAMDIHVPQEVKRVSDGLQYRDFITVGLLLKDLKIRPEDKYAKLISDNWIYIQEPDVLAGRLQIFNNWSPHLVANPDTVWIGVEYFCYETDAIWKMSDAEMANLAIQELAKIDIIRSEDVLDSTVVHVPKTYPAYFGSYCEFDKLREFTDRFSNLFLVGRNGMHKYNNQDHSMLTAMTAVDNIIAGRTDKANIWDVNTEMEYHESKASESPETTQPAIHPKEVAVGSE